MRLTRSRLPIPRRRPLPPQRNAKRSPPHTARRRQHPTNRPPLAVRNPPIRSRRIGRAHQIPQTLNRHPRTPRMTPNSLRISNPIIRLPRHHPQLATQLANLLLQLTHLTAGIQSILPKLLHPPQIARPRIHIRRPRRRPPRQQPRQNRPRQGDYRDDRRRVHTTFPPSGSAHPAITETA
jgi:hypothetical protein